MSALEQVIPEGYKQTDVGIIPIDWESLELGSFVQSLDAGVSVNSIDRPDAFSHGLHILKTSCVLKGYFFPSEIKSIIPEDTDRAKTIVSKGSIIVSRMNTPDLVGELGYVDKDYTSCFLPDRLWQMRFRGNVKINTRWLAYILSFPVIAKKIKESATGTSNSMKNISKGSLLSVRFPAPTYEEQTAIAHALTDVDVLLTELEKLIVKKQAIKSATMQQLFTGKTRLPQFSMREDGSPKRTKQSELGEIPEDWEVVTFGQLFEQSISRKSLKADMTTTFVGMQDVSESARLIKQTPVIVSKVKSGFTYFERNDVLVAKITPCFENGKGCHTKKLDTEHGFGSTEFHVLRAKLNTDSDFIYFWTTRDIFRQELESEMVGSAGHRRVPFSALQNYKIPCPDSKEEQTAIATILSDIDSEIQTLEQRLAKTRQIKQGMMQELLTGRIRLPYDKE